jgi:hypothetical protein
VRTDPSLFIGLKSDVVSNLIPNSALHYAVISVRSGPCCERLVIAYPDEKSLQALIAAPSILGLGYRSRKEAQANIDRCATTAGHSWRKLTMALVSTIGSRFEFIASHQFPGGTASFERMGCIIGDLVHRSLALSIAVLYSKNVLSAAIRALILF